MPTVNVLRDQLFQRLGQVFSESSLIAIQQLTALPFTAADDEFADLCFNFGLELDDVVSASCVIGACLADNRGLCRRRRRSR